MTNSKIYNTHNPYGSNVYNPYDSGLYQRTNVYSNNDNFDNQTQSLEKDENGVYKMYRSKEHINNRSNECINRQKDNNSNYKGNPSESKASSKSKDLMLNLVSTDRKNTLKHNNIVGVNQVSKINNSNNEKDVQLHEKPSMERSIDSPIVQYKKQIQR